MAIDVAAIYQAAATALGNAMAIIIAIGMVFVVPKIAIRWVRRALIDSGVTSDYYRRQQASWGGGGPIYFGDGDTLPGLSEDEYERRRLAAIDLEAEAEDEREFREQEDAYWRARGY